MLMQLVSTYTTTHKNLTHEGLRAVGVMTTNYFDPFYVHHRIRNNPKRYDRLVPFEQLFL